jgi:ElaB/YqjD/DUF883 family membrane-anchored ribosome-binding protein
MDRITVETSPSPLVKIGRINGNLRLKGWDRPSLRADSEREETLTIEQNESGLNLNSKSSCLARVPMESQLEIKRIDGELMVKSVEGQITAEEIYGHFFAKSIGSTKIGTVSGNLTARIVEGNFSCQEVKGNATLQDIEGILALDNVKGNLKVKGVCRGIKAAVKGNASLQLEPENQGDLHVEAKGNINCRLTADSSATIILKSNTERIQIKMAGKSETIKAKEHQLVLGEGDSEITLVSRGTIDFTVPAENDFDWRFEFDFEDDASRVSEDISLIVTEQLETQLDSLNEHLDSITSNLNTIGPAATEKAKAKFEAQRIKLERKLSQVERRIENKTRTASRRISRRITNTPPSDPVTDDERQKVLEMLQNKLISVEDAEKLLAALEGRQPEIPGAPPEKE